MRCGDLGINDMETLIRRRKPTCACEQAPAWLTGGRHWSKNNAKHTYEGLKQPGFQYQRGINAFRKLRPQTAAAGTPRSARNTQRCMEPASNAALNTKKLISRAKPEGLRCWDPNSWSEIRPTNSGPKPVKTNHLLRSSFHHCGDATEGKAKDWRGTGVRDRRRVPQQRCKSRFRNLLRRRHKPQQSGIKLKTDLCTAGETWSAHSELRVLPGPPAEGRSVPSKILQWMRGFAAQTVRAAQQTGLQWEQPDEVGPFSCARRARPGPVRPSLKSELAPGSRSV